MQENKKEALQKKAIELTKEVAHLLRLSDWVFRIFVVNATDIGGDVGQCQYNLNNREADVYVAFPGQYNKAAHSQEEEFYRTIIHEVAHVVIAKVMGGPPRDQSKFQEIAVENSVESIVNAIWVLLEKTQEKKNGNKKTNKKA